MLNPFDPLSKILKLLNSDQRPFQIGFGVAFGAILALTPFFSLHNLIVIALILIFNVSIASSFLGFAFLSPLSFVLNPLSLSIGEILLLANSHFIEFWTHFQSKAILPFFRFNNTLVLGSLVLSLVLFFPTAFGVSFLIKKYRHHWKTAFVKTKLYKTLNQSKIISFLIKIYKWIPK